jgi:hypothetical protein
MEDGLARLRRRHASGHKHKDSKEYCALHSSRRSAPRGRRAKPPSWGHYAGLCLRSGFEKFRFRNNYDYSSEVIVVAVSI